jgi:hypothetical protein
LLTPVSEEPGAASLLFLLEEARNRLQSLQHSIDLALQTVATLISQEYYAEGVRFLESQPPSIQDSPPVQAALKQLREANDNELAGLQAVGKAYAALDRSDINVSVLENLEEKGKSTLLTRIVPVFTSRRKLMADRQLSSTLEQARAAMDTGDKKQAARALKAAKVLAEYASSNLHNEWQALSREVEKGKALGRLGQK